MRIGVIGAGTIGRVRIDTIRANPATELVAVYDISLQTAQSVCQGTQAKPCSDLMNFLDTDMDAVIVATPPHLHEEACVGAFSRGRHVLCEKPLSNTVEAGQRIVHAAIQAGRILAVGFNLRYYPHIKFVRNALNEGLVGKIDHVRVFGGHNGLHNFRADWQYKAPESGGGAMMDIGIHMTDLARYALGDITTVFGVMSESVWEVRGSEDNAIATFVSPTGIPASYHATWYEWQGYRTFLEVYGSKGMVRGAYAPMQNLLITGENSSGKRRVVKRYYPEIMIREKLRTWKSTLRLSFVEELRDFIAMTQGNYNVPLADGHDGLRSLEVAAAVRQSTSTRQAVHLPPLARMR